MTEPAAAKIDEMIPEEYDLVVFGSGEGSKFVAWTLAKQGQRVAVVERKWIGGSCPNIACLPSKNIIHSAKVASYFKRVAEFGIASSGYTIDMAAVRGRKRTMVKGLVDVHVRNFQNSGAELLLGNGTFVGPDLVQVDMQDGTTRKLRGKNVLIGTGTRAHLDDIQGLAAAKPLTHIEALELGVLPTSVLVLGGGYIGLEFAQALRRLGSQVSVLERNTSLRVFTLLPLLTGVGRSNHGHILQRAAELAEQHQLKALLAEEQFGQNDITRAYVAVAKGSKGKVVLEL